MRCGGGIGVVWGLFRHGMATREFRSHQPPSKTGIKLQLKPVLTSIYYIYLVLLEKIFSRHFNHSGTSFLKMFVRSGVDSAFAKQKPVL